jgi:hypothetical protein
MCRNKTALAAFSQCQWLSGYEHDLQALFQQITAQNSEICVCQKMMIDFERI